MATPNLPMSTLLASMALVNEAISAFFAAMRPSKLEIAPFSIPVMSASSCSISSFMVLRMPVISPLWGTYPPWLLIARKEVRISRSDELMSTLDSEMRRRADAPGVCKKAPAMPDSMAGIALLSAAMFVFKSLDSFAKVAASDARSFSAFAIAALASSRPIFAFFSSASVCAFLAVSDSMLEATLGILSSAPAIVAASEPSDVLQ
mmetsp:Transcript_76807/g.132896  ORF Transcript_76807/g.132896 Transcript_76807/m.132896 type:complete len:205 (-) Transcript_76807:274-888(-)